MVFLKQNIWLILTVLTSGLMLAFPNLFGKMASANEVDINDAVKLINHEDALVLDVREASEFSSGHIANARHVPLGQLKSRLTTLEAFKDRTIVVNCKSGNRSAMACGILRKAGFTKVYNLKGGIVAWQREQMPTTLK